MALGFGFNKAKVLSSAEKFVQQGKLANAVAEYEKVIQNDPKDLTVVNTLGDLYARLGKNDDAVQCFRKVGDAYAAEGFAVKAIALYKKITKLNPKAMDCAQKLADLYTMQGLHTDARAQYTQIAEHYLRAGEMEPASRIFHKMLELDPENTSVQSRLAELYTRLGKKAEAAEIFVAAAEALHARGALDAASTALDRVLTLDKENTKALTLRAQIAQETGQPEKAVAALKKVANSGKLEDKPDAMHTLLQAEIADQHFEEAERLARKLAGQNDLNGITKLLEGLLSTEGGDYAEHAVRLLKEFSDKLKKHDGATYSALLGNAVGKVSTDPASLEILLALLRDIDDKALIAEATEFLAHAYAHEGFMERARDLYKQLCEMEPGNAEHEQNYRQMNAKLGNDAAKRSLTKEEAGQAFMENDAEIGEVTVGPAQQKYTEDLAEAVEAALTDAELLQVYNMAPKAIEALEAVLPRAPKDVRLNQRLATLYAKFERYTDAAARCEVLRKVFEEGGFASEATQYAEMVKRYRQRTGGGDAVDIPLATEKLAERQAEKASEEFEVSVSKPADIEVTPAAPPATPQVVVAETVVQAVQEANPAPLPVEVAPPPPPPAAIDQPQPHAEFEIEVTQEPDLIVEEAQPELRAEIVESPVEAPQVIEPEPQPAEAAPLTPVQVGLKDKGDKNKKGAKTGQDDWESMLAVEEPESAEVSEVAAPAEAEVAHATKPQAEQEIEIVEGPDEEEVINDYLDEARFFISQSMFKEARVALKHVAELAPDRPELAELRAQLYKAESPAEAEQPAKPAATKKRVAPPPSPPEPEPEPEVVLEAEAAPEDDIMLELDGLGEPEPEIMVPPPPKPSKHVAPPAPPKKPARLPAAAKQDNVLGDFAAELDDVLGDDFLGQPTPAAASKRAPELKRAPEVKPAAYAAAASAGPVSNGSNGMHPFVPERPQAPPPADTNFDSLLGDIFDEFKAEVENEQATAGDIEQHYTLGIAFKDMGLLDEAIGELQKVCNAIERGQAFHDAVQAYTWLAHCLVENGVPQAGLRWYEKALKMPGLDPDSVVAIHYDMGLACERAGNRDAALHHFTEVYGANIDYRDVAERIQAVRG
jgi:tetratricopeptide (TPR) repeat protein